MPLPSLTFAGNLKDVPGLVASGALSEVALSQAKINFRSNIPEDAYVTFGGTAYRINQINARVDTDGDIVNVDGGPVLLLANDDGLNVRNVQWRVRVEIPSQVIPPSPSGGLRSFWFNATEPGATIQLNTVIPVLRQDVFGTGGAGGLDQAALIGLINTDGTPLREALDAIYEESGGSSATWSTLPDRPAALVVGPNAAGGYPVLDGGGKLPPEQMPDISLITYKGAKANQAAMLATTGEQGDWVTRTDEPNVGTWVITGVDPTQLSSWTKLPFPTVDMSGKADQTTVDELRVASMRAEAYVDFSTQANGDPKATLDTGQAVDFLISDGSGWKPQISSGKLIRGGTLPSSGNYADYYQAQLDGDIAVFGTRWTVNTADGSTAATMCIAVWDTIFEGAGGTPPKTPAHITFDTVTGAWAWWVSDGGGVGSSHLKAVKTGTFVPPASNGSAVWECAVYVDADNGIGYLMLPGNDVATGSRYITVTDAEIATLLTAQGVPVTTLAATLAGADVLMIEHFANVTPDTGRYPRFLDVWGETKKVPRESKRSILNRSLFAPLLAFISTATATFTNKTLTNPRTSTIMDLNGVPALNLSPTASAVNYVQLVSGATGVPASIRAAGTAADVDLNLRGKGAGRVTIGSTNDPVATEAYVNAVAPVTYLPAPTGVAATDTANLSAAIAGLGSGTGVLVMRKGDYAINAPLPRMYPGQSLYGQGQGLSRILYTGTGICLQAYDATAWGSGGPGRGGIFADFSIDGTGAGAGSAGLRLGDMSGITARDIRISNFTGTGSVGIWFYNQVTWSERIHAKVHLSRNATNVLFEQGAGFNSFGYGKFWFDIVADSNQNGMVLRNGALLYFGELTHVGNYAVGAGNTGTVLTIGDGGSGDGSKIDHMQMNFTCETTGNVGGHVGHKTIVMSTSQDALLDAYGQLQFMNGNGIGFSVGSSNTRFIFTGRTNVDTVFGKATYWQAGRDKGIRTGSNAFVDTTGNIMYLSGQGQSLAGTFASGVHAMTIDSGISALANTGQTCDWDVLFIQPSSGAPATFSWPGNIVWIEGAAPTTQTANNARDWFRIWTRDFVTFYGTHINRADGGGDATTSTVQSFSNKRIIQRVLTPTVAAAPTFNTDQADLVSLVGQNVNITSMTTNVTGTPQPGDVLVMEITDAGTAISIAWGTKWESGAWNLPTLTIPNVRMSMEFAWNALTAKWRLQGLSGHYGSLGLTSIEMGAPGSTNTTITTPSAGVIAIEGFSAVTVAAPSTISSATTLSAIAGRIYAYFLASGALPTMPTAVGNTSRYEIFNTTASPIAITPASGQQINSAGANVAYSLAAGSSVILVSDNAGWRIF